ncbi:MAG TPA: hypothetical protein VFT72_20090 [Opitutaceae bacterium]|nr:hypothetical protein [Opitutaceae bacterium]
MDTPSNALKNKMRGGTDPRAKPALWLGLGLLLLLEFLVFDKIGSRHQSWVYPRWNDQIQYLSESYYGFEHTKTVGLATGLREALVNPSAQGTLHDFWAILLFWFVGPSRSAALSLNMLAFLAWQVAVFALALRQTKSKSAAFVAAALLLTLRSGWADEPGSAFDFRLDWFAVCTMGIALAAAENTDRFQRLGGAILFGLATALVLLTRFLTGTYFFLIYLAFATWVLAAPENRVRRLVNLLISALIAFAVAGPIFWINRRIVFDYYLIGHFTGPESALRSPNMGLRRSADWLFSHVQSMHVGTVYPWLWAIALVAASVGLLIRPASPREKNFRFVPRYPALFPALVFFIAPAIILILHRQKSEYVLGIMIPGLAAAAWLLLQRFLVPCGSRTRAYIAAGVVSLCFGCFFVTMKHDPHSGEFTASARHVATLADYIAKRSARAKLEHPRVAVDRVTDCLDAQVLRVICYERQHRWIPFIMTLPTGIEAQDPALYWERLHHSDFVFLTEEGDAGAWPYDHQLASLRAETNAWAESNLKLVDEIAFPGLRMALFERPDLP